MKNYLLALLMVSALGCLESNEATDVDAATASFIEDEEDFQPSACSIWPTGPICRAWTCCFGDITPKPCCPNLPEPVGVGAN